MTSLRLNLNSPVVDLAVRWTKEEKQFRVGVLEPFSSSIWQEKLRDFKLRGWNELRVDLLAEDVMKKQELRLSDFQDPHGGEHNVSVEISALRQSSLQDLSLVLEQDKHLAELCINDVDDQAMPALCRGAAGLRSFQLAGCGLTDAAGKPLAQLLKVSETLRKLSLANNRLGCEAAACLATGLQSNDFLCELYLQQNAIADKGCSLLAKSLEANPYVLETLDVSDNSFSEVGRSALEAAFGVSCSLAVLRLGQRGAHHVLEKSPTAAVGLQGEAPLAGTARRGFDFVVHCHRLGAEIWAQTTADPIDHPGKLVDMQQDDKDLDLVFSVPRLEPTASAAVSLSATTMKITSLDQTLVDMQLFSKIDPTTYELSFRDSILEVSLTKANEGEQWPRLEK
ncbi:NLRP5 [Symbiodinium natans]|uniref:NLRP5 protein n=1 Tax=Symbiodinium natans TaxID=878477 RepID=A0A812M2H2_9DINO|nr:NLRP5 [Symbiodinium natans]